MGIDEALATDNAIEIPDGVVARQRQLTPSELNAAHAGDRFLGSAYRVDGLDKLLEKLGLKDKAQPPQDAVSYYRVAPLTEGRFIVPKTHALYGNAAVDDSAVARSECAALVQCLGVSNTKYWRRGPRVQQMRPQQIERGTVIATLRNGIYLSDYSGQSHVGIYLTHDAGGLWMLDQFAGGSGTVGIRRKVFGARHDERKVKPSDCIGRSYRREVIDKNGNKIYGQDFRYQTVGKRVTLTSDGSEYYILLDDGKVARQDAAPDLRPSKEESKQFVKELVDEMFGPLREFNENRNAL